MNSLPKGETAEGTPRIRIRIHRVEVGETWIVRFRDYSALGLLTHYVKGVGSVYCGPHCQNPTHRLPQTWKGYASADYWDTERGIWMPCCLEITEGLEHTLRGVVARGQVWEISRLASEGKGRKSPVSGRLLEERDPVQCPLPFGLADTLHSVYHAVVTLDVRNPIPPKPVHAIATDAPPAAVVAARVVDRPPAITEEQVRRSRLNAIRTGLIPRGKYPELDRVVFGRDPAEESADHGRNGHS
jgi:hypothetical protein